jgi:hypothetical protein
MTQDTIDELRKENGRSELHKSLLDHATALVKMSRSKISRFYPSWDLQNSVYHGERYFDREDIEQSKKGKPVKMVVPNTFAQVMTFSSFLFLMFKQNRNFFELTPTGNEDYGTKEQDCELVLERDLQRNKWSTLLFQHLLDVGRFGPAVLECSWTRKLTRAYVTSQPQVVNYQGANIEIHGNSEWQEYVKYEGNLVRSVSPYRFFPDMRHPLVDFQKGEFCAAEEEYSMTDLYALEAAGEVAGVQHIRPLTADWSKVRGGDTRTSLTAMMDGRETAWLYGPSQSQGTALVTKMQVRLVPSKFKIGPDNKKLGPEEFPVLYHLWYANDNRVIRCEPAGWWHDEFGWSVSQFTPDMHETVSLGLADLIYRLQDVISWHINARITDVRRNMRGRLVVDPAGVDESSLNGEGDIYLRKNVSKSGVDRWVKQLDSRDVTSGHMQDSEILSKLMQVVTGVNDNLMGQYNSGRRSAQESRTVLGGAAGRMKLHGHLIWDGGLGPLGKMMLSNSRQSLSQESFTKLIGNPDPQDQEAVANAMKRFKDFQGTPEEVITGDDYFTFDSTLSSEKGFMAQSIQELLSTILQSDPMAARRVTRDLDPSRIVEEIQYLRGAGNIKRFRYTPEERQQILAEEQAQMQAQQAAEAAKNAPKVSVALKGELTTEQEAKLAEQNGFGGGGRPQSAAVKASNGTERK